jgi:8-oxo-dGTP pyrophosphatase MutT (NUDIX family)
MTHILTGERIGKQGKLTLGCSAVLLDESGENVLLTRRADNGQWCLPGGRVEPGESVAEACAREVREETGLQVQVVRLTGIYSGRDRLVVYPDGNQFQVIALNFLVEYIEGKPALSDETTEIRFTPISEAVQMDLFNGHAERIRDAVSEAGETYIR